MSSDRKSRRAAALLCIAKFRAAHDLPITPLRFERRPDGYIALIGAASDGREYCVGYSVRA